MSRPADAIRQSDLEFAAFLERAAAAAPAIIRTERQRLATADERAMVRHVLELHRPHPTLTPTHH